MLNEADRRADALMAAYADGDERAFEELYRDYERAVFGFCLRLLGDPDVAADAFQETFKRVVDRRRAYEPRGRFSSWVFTIARRICLDAVRADKRRTPLETANTVPDTRLRHDALTDHRDEVAHYLAQLPSEQREVLLLHKYYGFSYGEIAEMVGGSEAGAKQKAYRALSALRALTPSGGASDDARGQKPSDVTFLPAEALVVREHDDP